MVAITRSKVISGPAWIPCDMQFYHQQSTDLRPFFDPLWQGFEMIVNMPRPEMTGILLHMFHQTFSRHALKPKLQVKVSFSLSPFHVAFIPDPWKWINSAPRTAMDNAVWEIVKGKRKLKKFCARQENLRPRKNRPAFAFFSRNGSLRSCGALECFHSVFDPHYLLSISCVNLPVYINLY